MLESSRLATARAFRSGCLCRGRNGNGQRQPQAKAVGIAFDKVLRTQAYQRVAESGVAHAQLVAQLVAGERAGAQEIDNALGELVSCPWIGGVVDIDDGQMR